MSRRTTRARDRSLDAIFCPKSVAVIGATSRAGTIGRELLANLTRSEFTGKVFPVNPKHSVVQCMKSYASVEDIEDEVDLGVILVPKDEVQGVAEACARKGVKGLVIISAGFREEVGDDGAAREARLRQLVQAHGMRALGPNCMGAINTDPAFNLNATFSRVRPPVGNVGFMSQSGALGDVIIAQAEQLGIGFSKFASMGNKMDIAGNDLLAYWADDPRTDVILLYLESFGDPRAFTRIARQVSRRKALVAVKAGRTDAGARAAFSHTGALAGLDAGVDALFEQCGVLRVASVGELFDVAMALSTQPLPAGKRIGIVTNAGGPGIMLTDACSNLGLEVPELSPPVRATLRQHLRPEASVRNPVDIIASGGPADYAAAVGACYEDPGIDALAVLFIPPVMINAPEVARAVVEAVERARRRHPPKPVLTCFMHTTPSCREAVATLRQAGLPVYLYPESVARALAAMVQRRSWLDRAEGEVPALEVDAAAARAVIDAARAGGREVLEAGEVSALLEAYGVPVARFKLATSMEECALAADELGYPVVLKIQAPELVHKTDVGGVLTDVRNVAELVDGYRALRKLVEARGLHDAKLIVQPMIRGGREVIFGMTKDPAFGPLLMFGLGGVDVEVLHDVTFRIHPITDVDAAEMVRAVRARRLLEGFRGEPAADLALLQQVLLRLSRLVEDLPEIEQIEINPFLVCAPGGDSRAVDARVLLGAI